MMHAYIDKDEDVEIQDFNRHLLDEKKYNIDPKIFSVKVITPNLLARLETGIKSALQEKISFAFPAELGFIEGTEKFEICHQTVEHTLTRIFSEYGKPVQLFVDCIEGEVDLTLPEDLFGELLKGEGDSLLSPSDDVQFMMKKVINEIKTK